MDKAEIFEKVKKLCAEQLDIDEAKVVESASFQDDLEADSLDLVEMIMALEDEFDIKISDEEAENIKTVGDAVKYITDKV